MKLSKITLACALAAGMAAPQIASADDSFEFHGYARWGTVYEADGNTSIGPEGAGPMNASGRLGNEGFGGEWLFLKKFEGENGTKWDLGLMIEDWYELGMKQAYAGVSNVFESQPNAYLWAGKVFHSRVQQGLNDYFVVTTDSQGAGIKGVDLGFANLELGVVGGEHNGTYSKSGDGKGNYAVTSKLSGIKLGDAVSMDLLANYGFSDDTVTADDAYIGMAKFSGWNQNFYMRYSENSERNVLSKTDDLSSHYVSVDGGYSLGERTGLEYLVSHHDIDAPADSDDRAVSDAIVRVTHSWNDIHSTWIEAGTALVDYDNGDESTASKVTWSQNIAIGGVPWARPMLRFYVTAGEEENRAGETENPVIAGAMFEAWW